MVRRQRQTGFAESVACCRPLAVKRAVLSPLGQSCARRPRALADCLTRRTNWQRAWCPAVPLAPGQRGRRRAWLIRDGVAFTDEDLAERKPLPDLLGWWRDNCLMLAILR